MARGAHGHTEARGAAPSRSRQSSSKKPSRQSGFSAALPPSGSRENSLFWQRKVPEPPRVYPLSLPSARGELTAKQDVQVPIGEQSLHNKTLEELLSGWQH